jgi:hypothetical protein
VRAAAAVMDAMRHGRPHERTHTQVKWGTCPAPRAAWHIMACHGPTVSR